MCDIRGHQYDAGRTHGRLEAACRIADAEADALIQHDRAEAQLARATRAEARVAFLEGLLREDVHVLADGSLRTALIQRGATDVLSELRRRAGLDKQEPAKPPTHRCLTCGQWLRLMPNMSRTSCEHGTKGRGPLDRPCLGTLMPVPFTPDPEDAK